MEKEIYVPETFEEWKKLHTERHMSGEEANQATWVWDDNALCNSFGGYVCSSCKVINQNMPLNKYVDYRRCQGIEYCPNCGLKMNIDAVYGCKYEPKEWQARG